MYKVLSYIILYVWVYIVSIYYVWYCSFCKRLRNKPYTIANGFAISRTQYTLNTYDIPVLLLLSWASHMIYTVYKSIVHEIYDTQEVYIVYVRVTVQ
jgi:hypothetical protein